MIKKLKSIICFTLAFSILLISMPLENVKAASVVDTGTMSSGAITWTLTDDGVLKITGDGTISLSARSASGTKEYSYSLNNISLNLPKYFANTNITMDADGNWLNSVYDTSEATDTTGMDLGSSDFSFSDTINASSSDLSTAIPWASHASEIKTIYVDSNVKLTGNFSFYFNGNENDADGNFSYVNPVNITDSIYTNLETIYLLADTSGITAASGMFAKIKSLKNIYVNCSFNTSSLTDASGMFYGDTNLKNDADGSYLSLVDQFSDTSKITDIRYMFFGCKSITEPAIGSWNLGQCVDMSYAFMGANSMNLIADGSGRSNDISGWNLTNVKSLLGTFAGSEVDIDTTDPTTDLWDETDSDVISGVFDISSWNLQSIQCMAFTFSQNPYLTGFTCKNTTVPVLTDVMAAFAFDNGLETVDLSSLDTTSLLYTSLMFYKAGADNATANLSSWHITNVTQATSMFYNSGFKSINFDNTNPAALVNASGMFYKCKLLNSLGSQALSSWTLNNVTNAAFMFADDVSLVSLDTSNWGMSSVETLAYFASNTESLSAIDASSWSPSNLTNMICAFDHSGITSFDISSWNTLALNYMDFAFANSKLTSFNDNAARLTALKSTVGTFFNCSDLTSVTFSEGNTPVSLTNACCMFANDTNLTEVKISNLVGPATTNISGILYNTKISDSSDFVSWDTSAVTNANFAFAEDTELTDINASTLNLSNLQTALGMFMNDSKLTDTTVSLVSSGLAGNTALTNSEKMFYNCSSLSTVDFSGVDFTNDADMSFMFYGCDNLNHITVASTFGTGATAFEKVFYANSPVSTFFTVTGALPDILKDYDWNTDNRIFVTLNAEKINDATRTDYIFKKAGSATMAVDATSTFTANGEVLPLDYSWTYDDKALDVSVPTLTVTEAAPGTYKVNTSVAALTKDAGTSTSFDIASQIITGIEAKFNGEKVSIGSEISKDDVTVEVVYSDGTKTKLKSDQFTLKNNKISKEGANTVTAYYTDDEEDTFSSDFNVTGYRRVGSIVASYSGPDVEVGSQYDSSKVTVTAYYEDDTNKNEGFKVTPSALSSTEVKSVGANKYTASYSDENEGSNILTGEFTVTGYSHHADSITAKYNGGYVQIGADYDLSNVIVTVHFADGTEDKTVTNFTVDSQTVKEVGLNTFTASWTDDYGNALTAEFVVTGTNEDGVGAQTSDHLNMFGLLASAGGLFGLLAVLVRKRRSLI